MNVEWKMLISSRGSWEDLMDEVVWSQILDSEQTFKW